MNFIHKSGSTTIYFDDQNLYHRENGPAFISERLEMWCIHNKLHRIDGPAVTIKGINNERYEWYYNDEKINCSSQEEFEKLIKLKIFW